MENKDAFTNWSVNLTTVLVTSFSCNDYGYNKLEHMKDKQYLWQNTLDQIFVWSPTILIICWYPGLISVGIKFTEPDLSDDKYSTC